jgi:hypothetical protein
MQDSSSDVLYDETQESVLINNNTKAGFYTYIAWIGIYLVK